jgi:predicted amidohydrolase
MKSVFSVAAASPARTPGSPYRAYGHSLIVDPWGTMLAVAEAVRLALLEMKSMSNCISQIRHVRRKLKNPA